MATLPRVGAATQMGRSAIRGLASPFKKAFPIFSSKQHYSRSSKSGSMQSAAQSMVETNILLEKTLLVAKQENELLTRILRTLTLIEDSDLGLGGSPGGLLNTIMGAIDGMLGAFGLKKLYNRWTNKAKPPPKGARTPKAETKPGTEPTIKEPVENPQVKEPAKPKPANDNATKPGTEPNIEKPVVEETPKAETKPGAEPTIKEPVENSQVKEPAKPKPANDNAKFPEELKPYKPVKPTAIDIPKAANDASLVAGEKLGATSAADVAGVSKTLSSTAIKGAAGLVSGTAIKRAAGELAFGPVGLAAQIILTPSETYRGYDVPSITEQELRPQIIQHETELKKAKEELDNISKNPSNYSQQYITVTNNRVTKLTTTLANEKSTYNNLIDQRRVGLQHLGWSEENINRQIPPSLYFMTEEVNPIPATPTKGSELKQGSMTYEISNFTNNPPTQMTINNNQIVNPASAQQAAQDIREELVSLYRRIMGLGNY